jgi:hypothetical protein
VKRFLRFAAETALRALLEGSLHRGRVTLTIAPHRRTPMNPRNLRGKNVAIYVRFTSVLNIDPAHLCAQLSRRPEVQLTEGSASAVSNAPRNEWKHA